MAAEVTTIEVLVEGLDHPEGVAFDHERGFLYSGGEQGQIYRIDLEQRSVHEVGRTPGFVLGLAIDGRGRVVVCDSDDGAIWVLDGERLTRVIDSVGDVALSMPNYPAFGPDGTLYFTDSGGWNLDTGRTVALGPDGTATVLNDTLTRFPNGCAVSGDGKELWVLQSEGEDLHRIDLENGGKPEKLVDLAGTVPDGIAFTADGGTLISCYRPDRIYYLSPDGELEILVEDYQGTVLAAPTNVAFVGAEMTTVVSANLGRWHLTILETNLRGVKPHAPRIWAFDGVSAP